MGHLVHTVKLSDGGKGNVKGEGMVAGNRPQDSSESWGFMFPLRDTFSHSRST